MSEEYIDPKLSNAVSNNLSDKINNFINSLEIIDNENDEVLIIKSPHSNTSVISIETVFKNAKLEPIDYSLRPNRYIVIEKDGYKQVFVKYKKFKRKYI